MCKTFDNIDMDINLSESINDNIDELVNKSIQIDNKGNIFPKYEAVGGHCLYTSFKHCGLG